MVDRKFAGENLLQVLAYVPETEMEALQGLKLGCYAGRKGADCDVSNIT